MGDVNQYTFSNKDTLKEKTKVRESRTPNAVDMAIIEGMELNHYTVHITSGVLPPREKYEKAAAYISIRRNRKDNGNEIAREFMRLSTERLETLISDLITVSLAMRMLDGEQEQDIKDCFDLTIEKGVTRAVEFYNTIKRVAYGGVQYTLKSLYK